MKAANCIAAVVQVLAPAAEVTVFAQPSGPGISKERGHARLFVEPLLARV
jgi:hypothetical protein